MNIGELLDSLPDEFKSRKLVLIVFTMIVILLIAIVGAIIVHFLDADQQLFRDAMMYVTGAGTGGTVAQAVPDSLQARNGTYRPTDTPMFTPGVLNPPPAVSSTTPVYPVTPVAPLQPVSEASEPVEANQTPKSIFGR